MNFICNFFCKIINKVEVEVFHISLHFQNFQFSIWSFSIKLGKWSGSAPDVIGRWKVPDHMSLMPDTI